MTRLLLTLVLFLAGCAANVLLPAVQSTWPSVRSDIDRGLVDATEDGDLDDAQSIAHRLLLEQLDAALAAGDTAATCAADWPTLRAFAERGVLDQIDDGEIGVGVAASLRERQARFFEAAAELCGGGR